MNTHACTTYAAALVVALGIGLQTAEAGNDGRQNGESKWELTIGGGLGLGPDYEGSDDYEAMPFPIFQLEWNDFLFLSPGDGLGVKMEVAEDFEVTASIGYDGGRDDGDNSILRGLGDIDGAATANLGIEYDMGPFSPFAKFEKHFGGTDGMLVDFGVEAMMPLTGSSKRGRQDGPMLSVGVFTQWADDNYMEEYFGITAVQSGRSGLSRYTAGAGFKSAGAEIGVLYPVSKNWFVNTKLEYSRLIGDAADSPIVKEENQFSGGIFVGYKF
jgi:outer membrane scaffolding protein for murein synthesis (MipA/OmpV family)